MMRTASWGSSVCQSRSRSSLLTIPCASRKSRTHAIERRPVLGAEEHHREVEDLPGLDQRQRLEQLVERAEAAGEDDERLGRLHEHHLARVEVAERDLEIEVVVRELLVRELDVEADGEPAALARAAVRGLHAARAAAGHDRPALLGEEARDLAGRVVRRMPLADAGRAEHRHGRVGDLRDGLEALEELVRDARDAAAVAVLPLEKFPVVHRSMVARPTTRGASRRPSWIS